MSKLIKNNKFIQTKLEGCIEILKEKDSDLIDTFEVALNEDFLSVDLIKSLKTYWNKYNENKLYLHELLAKTELYLPKLEVAPRDPALEQRIQELRAKLEEEAYQNMVYNVDMNSPLRFDNSIKSGTVVPEFKTLQGQIIAIINTFAVIGGSFFFGYKAVEYSLPEPDITKQIVAGLILALIVAIADLYFLFQKLLRIDNKFDKKKTVIKQVKSTTQPKLKSKLDKKKD